MATAAAMRPTSDLRLSGYTLVEMIVVIAIIAIVAAAVAVFLRAPLQSYQDAQGRASVSDAADTAFTRIRRDLQSALPNSVRVTSAGSVFYLEFLQTLTGGRYRAEDTEPATATGANSCPDVNGNAQADENVLRFAAADTCFTTLGGVPKLSAIVPNRDFVVVYNLGVGFPNADAYANGNVTAIGGNKSLITATAPGGGGENVFTFQSHAFSLESPARRFQVVSGPVTYACDPGAGVLQRISGYAISAVQSTPPGGSAALLARNVAACSISYDVVNQRQGVVSIWLRLADPSGGGAVNLFQQVQVSNVP